MLLQTGPPLPSCASTQSLALALAGEGAKEGTTVWALEQTSGRGRGVHRWESPAGHGLWVSFILRPPAPTSAWPVLTPLVALSAAHAIEDLAEVRLGPSLPAPLRVGIKWPNDLFGALGKLGGVLAQVVDRAVVLGVGVNLTQRPVDFPTELQGHASSLEIEGVRRVTPLELLEQFNVHLTTAYDSFQNGETSFLRPGLQARFYLRDAEIEIDAGGGARVGKVIDVGKAGELCVRINGREEMIFGGTVTRFELARPWKL